MSIATMNWALQQRLASPQQQILLYVIADSANPSGVTVHCDPDYLVRHSRLSRATVFRRLGEMRELGLLETVSTQGHKGVREYEIRLNLEAQIQVPLRGEGGDDASGDEGAESQAETQPQSQPETGTVSPVRPAQSHSCDSISPPLSKKDSPPSPPPGGNATIDDRAREKFTAAFWPDYPNRRVMDEGRALQVFAALDASEQDLAVTAVPHYAADLRRADRKPKDAYKWLRDRGFAQYQSVAAKPSAAAKDIWIDDPDALAALRVVRAIGGLPEPFFTERGGKTGQLNHAPVGADLRGLAAFAGQGVDDWDVVAADTAEFNAWRHRIHEWTGRWIGTRTVYRPGMRPVPGQPGREERNRAEGLPVPCRWPPRKDGSIGERDDPPMAPELTNDDRDALAQEGRR